MLQAGRHRFDFRFPWGNIMQGPYFSNLIRMFPNRKTCFHSGEHTRRQEYGMNPRGGIDLYKEGLVVLHVKPYVF